MTQGSPPARPLHPWRQRGNPTVDSSTSACNIQRLPASDARTNMVYASAHSSSRFKSIRVPHRSSSSEPLAPISTDFKRWRHQRRSRLPTLSSSLPHGQIRNDCHHLPASVVVDLVDDYHGSATEVRPLNAAASKSCIQPMRPSPNCADWALSITSELDDSVNAAPSITCRQRHTMDLHLEDVTDDDDDDDDAVGGTDKEEVERKLIMWRAACAMAHAYLHQQDLHESSYHIIARRHPIPNHNAKSLQTGGPFLEDETYYARVTKHTKTPHPCSSPPSPPAATSTSSTNEVYPPSMCDLGDVVCIDEVVNPTQAAEWFGAQFSSTSTLVS